MNKVLEITDPEWLASIQEVRHITSTTMQEIGVPCRYLDLDDRTDRDNPFENYMLVGHGSKHALTDYILAALNVCKPGIRIMALTFPDMLDLLSMYGRDSKQKRYDSLVRCDALFIYDFGLFHIKDWEMKNVGMYLMDRYNNSKPVSMAVEGVEPSHIVKHVGHVLWQMVKDNSLCRSV